MSVLARSSGNARPSKHGQSLVRLMGAMLATVASAGFSPC
jgi:hypothetical protein